MSSRRVCLQRCSAASRKFWRDMLVLFFLTFCVILPGISLSMRHTVYDRFISKDEAREKLRMKAENTKRLSSSLNYLKYLNNTEDYKRLKINFETRLSSNDPLFRISNRMNTTLAITIITVSRNRHTIENYEPRYLTQTVASFLRLMNSSTHGPIHFRMGLFVCNVDPQPDSYEEVKLLPKWISVFQRFPVKSVPLFNMPYDARLEKEKQDYVFCLERSLAQNVTHVLLVEDDALPLPDVFSVIEHLVLSNSGNVGTSSSNNVTFYKLYHPERLLGYFSIEFERIPELLSLSCLSSLVVLLIYTKRWSKTSVPVSLLWIVFFIYSGLTFLAIGRVNIIEFRRISTFLYQLTPAPTCCTPAMLFPRQGGQLVADYLNSVTCRSKYAKDHALDEFRKKKGLIARMIQPNLFKHIGQFSSLRPALVNPFIV